MISRVLVILFALAACEYEDTLAQAYGYPPLAPSTGAATDVPTSTGDTPTGGEASGPIVTVTGDTSTGTSADATTGDSSSTGEPVPPPMIHSVDMPETIKAAGPVDVVVLAANAATVRGVLDGEDVYYFTNNGDGNGDSIDEFSATFPIFGSVDNGIDRTFEIIAERDGLEDSVTRLFDVAAPAAGVFAWEQFGGVGTRTNALAADPGGAAVFEGGGVKLGNTERPALRKREPQKGVDLWPAGWLNVDAREGAVADLAVTPEGRLWVAMNVRQGGGQWRARIALLEPDLQPTGIELEKPGATVTALGLDDEDGGCFGVGYQTTIYGDADVLMFRLSGDGSLVVSGQPWDYVPSVDDKAHDFSDLAFDVAVDSEAREAWIVGASQGKHNKNNQDIEVRGLIVRADIDLIEVQEPAIVAPPLGNMTQSVYKGAAKDPAGVLVAGYECNATCTMQRVTSLRVSAAGVPTSILSGELTTVAFGSSIARNAHGSILVAVTHKDVNTNTMQGRLLGIHDGQQTFSPFTFPGKGPSSAAAVVVGPYDWAFAGGSATTEGTSQAYAVRLFQ